MESGLRKDPILILRIDGEDLHEFVESPRFEPEAVAIFSSLQSTDVSLKDSLKTGLEQLTVEHGMPPATDTLVMTKIIEPALQNVSPDLLEQPASQDIFCQEFKKLLEDIVKLLQMHPVIVAHSENTFDGNGVKRLLSNKFELDKLLDSIWRDLPKDLNKSLKDHLRVALDKMSTSTDLPPYGAFDQVDAVINEACEMVNVDDGKEADKAEFQKTMTEILDRIILQLEGKPIFVSTNSVVHEPLVTNSVDIICRDE